MKKIRDVESHRPVDPGGAAPPWGSEADDYGSRGIGGPLDLVPGAALVAELVALGSGRLSDDDLGDGILAWERALSWGHGWQNRWILELARRTEGIAHGMTNTHPDGPCDSLETLDLAHETPEPDTAETANANATSVATEEDEATDVADQTDATRGTVVNGGSVAAGVNCPMGRLGGFPMYPLLSFQGGRCVAELSALLNLSRSEARSRIEAAEMLEMFLTGTSDALEAGTITPSKADMLVRRLKHRDIAVAITVEDSALRVGMKRPRHIMGRQIDAAIILADPDGAAKAHLAARIERRVEAPRQLADGMASLKAVVPADHAKLIHSNLTAIAQARQAEGDTRAVDQLRADTLLLLATDPGCCHATGPEHTAIPGPDNAHGHGVGNSNGAGTDDLGTERNLDGIGQKHARHGKVTAGHEQAPAGHGQAFSVTGRGSPIAHHVHSRSCREVLLTISVETLAAVLSGENLSAPSLETEASTWTGTEKRTDTMTDTEPGMGSEAGTETGAGTEAGAGNVSRIGAGVGFGRSGRGITVPFLTGYGPINPLLAAIFAVDHKSRWRLATTDETGMILSVTAQTYKPPPDMARVIRARQPECVFPSCDRPAQNCDLDHTIPYDHSDPSRGGQTTATNLAPLCRNHHNLKTLGLWHLAQPTQGQFEWTSALGRKYAYIPSRLERTSTVTDVFNPPRDISAVQGKCATTAEREVGTPNIRTRANNGAGALATRKGNDWTPSPSTPFSACSTAETRALEGSTVHGIFEPSLEDDYEPPPF